MCGAADCPRCSGPLSNDLHRCPLCQENFIHEDEKLCVACLTHLCINCHEEVTKKPTGACEACEEQQVSDAMLELAAFSDGLVWAW